MFGHKGVFPAMSTFSLPSGREGRRGSDSSVGKLVSQKTSDNTLSDAYVLAHISFFHQMSTFTLPKGGGRIGRGSPLRKIVSQNVSNGSYIALASIQNSSQPSILSLM